MAAQRVVLHVGAMKSGTSFLQSLMFANKDLLLERGVLLPGPKWAFQVRAVRSLFSGDGELWDRLGAEVGAHDGTSVVSMEFLGPLRPRVVRRAVERLPVEDVRVVVTARDLNRSIAAMWQETVQNGRTWTWEEYLEAITDWRPGHRAGQLETDAGRTFWRQQNIGRITRTWADVVGPEQVTLVTVPHPGAPRDLLWQRFASVVGVDHHGLEPARAANESIGAASALALRRLNELLEDGGLTRVDGAHLRKAVLAKQVLAVRKKQEPVIGLPVADWVRGQSRRMRTTLERTGVAVVGDLAELAPVEVPGVHPSTIDAHEVGEAALAALAWVLDERIRRERDEADARGEHPDDGSDDEAGTDPGDEQSDGGDDDEPDRPSRDGDPGRDGHEQDRST